MTMLDYNTLQLKARLQSSFVQASLGVQDDTRFTRVAEISEADIRKAPQKVSESPANHQN